LHVNPEWDIAGQRSLTDGHSNKRYWVNSPDLTVTISIDSHNKISKTKLNLHQY
jgi:hypothetical protein